MTRMFSDLAFYPSISEIVPTNASGALAILTGGNNSGKSAYLKKTIDDPRKLYVGVNRFYSFHHIGLYSDNAQEISQWYANMQNSTLHQAFQNYEGSFFNCATAISRLTNNRRETLFQVFTELFGIPIAVLAENPDNDFSNRYIAVDGDSLSVTSSGTRLFLGILAALMDDRFQTVAIDEPELGLSPTLQRRLADIIIRGDRRAVLFPHNPNIILSTHSHLFLDRNNPQNNWLVSKNQNLISARRCTGIHELHDIQFRLLGNDLSELFLPDAVLFVEGDTDKMYLERVLMQRLPKAKVTIQACSGDIAARLTYWSSSLGDMQISPYRTRTIVIYDKIKQAGIERACEKIGLPLQSRVEWLGNGIEYVYPASIISEIFRKSGINASDLIINGDFVTYGEIFYKKMELCRMVCDRLTVDTALPSEIQDKLIGRLQQLTI